MKIFLPLAALAVALIFYVTRPASEETIQPSTQADKQIKACWGISQDKRDSGVTQDMLAGTMETTACMKKHIMHLSETVLFKGDPHAQNIFKEALNNLQQGTALLYGYLHTRNALCEGPCGTLYQLSGPLAVADQMAQIIKAMYDKIDEYNPSSQP